MNQNDNNMNVRSWVLVKTSRSRSRSKFRGQGVDLDCDLSLRSIGHENLSMQDVGQTLIIKDMRSSGSENIYKSESFEVL